MCVNAAAGKCQVTEIARSRTYTRMGQRNMFCFCSHQVMHLMSLCDNPCSVQRSPPSCVTASLPPSAVIHLSSSHLLSFPSLVCIYRYAFIYFLFISALPSSICTWGVRWAMSPTLNNCELSSLLFFLLMSSCTHHLQVGPLSSSHVTLAVVAPYPNPSLTPLLCTLTYPLQLFSLLPPSIPT